VAASGYNVLRVHKNADYPIDKGREQKEVYDEIKTF
jgi:hypothetical protein